MKKTTILIGLLAFMSLTMQAERIEPIPFGNMDTWVVRYIKESRLLGGQTKMLYALGKTDTLKTAAAYHYDGKYNTNPWSCSNAYANVVGIEKAGGPTATPERRGNGYCARLDCKTLEVKVFGTIDIQVVAAGTLFTGRTIEPIKSANDPYQNIDFGVPFTRKPSYLMFDYKCKVSPEQWVWYAKAGKAKKLEGHDYAEVYMYLQHRWEDSKGNIHAKRVGTAYEAYQHDVNEWQNGHRVKVHYGDITKESWYNDEQMGFRGIERAMNSQGKIVPIREEGWDGSLQPTHMVIMLTSGRYEAFIGHTGNTLWIDNVKLVYDN